MNNDILCNICGHLDFHHLTKPWGYECFSCYNDLKHGWNKKEVSINHKYTPDNLRYLEQKALDK